VKDDKGEAGAVDVGLASETHTGCFCHVGLAFRDQIRRQCRECGEREFHQASDKTSSRIEFEYVHPNGILLYYGIRKRLYLQSNPCRSRHYHAHIVVSVCVYASVRSQTAAMTNCVCRGISHLDIIQKYERQPETKYPVPKCHPLNAFSMTL